MKYQNAYSLYQNGLSLKEVGEVLGVTRQCVYKAFKSRGYNLRATNQRDYQMYDGKKFTKRNSGYYSLSTGKRTLMHRYVWEKEIGKIPEGYDIHHIDETRSNNDILNLECLPKSEHIRLYSPHNNQYTIGRKRVTHRAV